MDEVNRVKAAAVRVRPIRGVHLTFPAPRIIEILAGLALDFVYLDAEHGTFDLDDVEQHCVVARQRAITPIARIPENNRATITRFLDRGVKGIVVPHVESADDARRAVDAAYFAPLGLRSYGGAFPDHLRGEAELPSFLEGCNRNISVCAMLESRAALDAAESIARIPGVDYVSFGMMDLAQSLGHPGEPRNAAVIRAVEHSSERIRRAGKPVREDFMTFAWIKDIIFTGGEQAVGRAPAPGGTKEVAPGAANRGLS